MKTKRNLICSLMYELRETGKRVLKYIQWKDFELNYLAAFWKTLEWTRLFKSGAIDLRTCRRECLAIRDSLWLSVLY